MSILASELKKHGYEIFMTTIPEPTTLVLLDMGAVGLLTYAWRRRKRA